MSGGSRRKIAGNYVVSCWMDMSGARSSATDDVFQRNHAAFDRSAPPGDHHHEKGKAGRTP